MKLKWVGGDMTKRLSILFPIPDPIPKTVKGEFQFSLIIYYRELLPFS